jgi:hypothetical protein
MNVVFVMDQDQQKVLTVLVTKFLVEILIMVK